MGKDFKFAIEDIQRLNIEEYDENEYCVGRMKFLSTRPNSHKLKFSEKVLRRYAKTVLGTWVVAEVFAGDFSTHTLKESIIGIVPKEQNIEFVKTEDGYLDAYVDIVLSKRYSKDACDIFVKDNDRSVSIEFNYVSAEDDEDEIKSFIIRGTTVLGKTVNPSVPTANLTITRFSEEEANKFFAKVHKNSLTVLKEFVEERKKSMAEGKTYKIDKSKDAMSETPWGEIGKTELRNKIMEAKNKADLVKAVYMLVETDWEEAPSERLHYPVMQFKGDTLVYNRNALSNALARAVQNNEDAVIDKIKKIYKSLGLEQDGKEEDAKMAEVNFEIEGREAWSEVIKKVQDHEGKDTYVDSVEKDHIIYTKDDVRYRVEADVKVGKDDKTVEAKIDWDTVKKDKVQKMSECEDEEDFAKKCAEMEKKLEDRDNIIMENEKKMKEMEEELADLREFKKACMEKEKASTVESVMNEVEDFVDAEQFKSLRDEGMACNFAQIDAWSNKVKAISFEKVKSTRKNKSDGFMRFSAPIGITIKSDSVWDRLKSL